MRLYWPLTGYAIHQLSSCVEVKHHYFHWGSLNLAQFASVWEQLSDGKPGSVWCSKLRSAARLLLFFWLINCLVYKMGENSENVQFSQRSPEDIQCTMKNKTKQKILTFEKFETANVYVFCLIFFWSLSGTGFSLQDSSSSVNWTSTWVWKHSPPLRNTLRSLSSGRHSWRTSSLAGHSSTQSWSLPRPFWLSTPSRSQRRPWPMEKVCSLHTQCQLLRQPKCHTHNLPMLKLQSSFTRTHAGEIFH